MPGDTALLCPTNRQDPVELSRTLWRKQVLPIGSINYKGRTIKFDRSYLSDLAESFRQGAFDQVPFLLAKDDNAHTMDPERYRGEVKGVELTDKGLDVLLDLTPDAAELVRQNPKLGVSARIIEGLERADGASFRRALQHVLGTLDPRVTGMGSWQEVALSDEVGDIIDITNEEVTLSDTQPPVTPQVPPESVPPGSPGSTTPNPEEPNPQRTGESEPEGDEELEDLSDEELAALTAEFQAAQGASLSGGDRKAIELLRATDLANQERIKALELELARQRFTNEARTYLEFGVPPVLVELARPILSMPQAPVIELSASESVDVGQLVRDMLEQTKGFIQLAQEHGTSFTQDSADDRASAILSDWGGGL